MKKSFEVEVRAARHCKILRLLGSVNRVILGNPGAGGLAPSQNIGSSGNHRDRSHSEPSEAILARNLAICNTMSYKLGACNANYAYRSTFRR